MDNWFINISRSTRKTLLASIQWVVYINTLIATVFLLYRYGFLPTEKETIFIFRCFDIQIVIFILLLIFRGLLSTFSDNNAQKSPAYYRKASKDGKKNWSSHYQKTFIAYLQNFYFYLKKEALEVFLISLAALHGFLNYVFDFKAVLYFYNLFSFKNPALAYQQTVSIYLFVLVLLETSRASTHISNLKIKPATTFILSFVILIFSGAGLLMMPAMVTSGNEIRFIDALFTSASASCVTGLIVVDTGTFFTFKGHLVIMLLIQLGGLGIVLFASFFATFLSGGVGLKHQAIMQDMLSSDSLAASKALLRKIVFITITVEFIGFLLIFFAWEEDRWFGQEGFKDFSQKFFYSVFHSVSAFCNAGFSLFTDGYYNNTLEIRQMYGLHTVTALVIIFGGLGFSTIEDIFSFQKIKERWKKPWKRYALGSQISIRTTIWLIVVGTVGFFILEFKNLTDRTIIEAAITAFFQSVVTRTAGFNTVDFGLLSNATIVLCIFLMFIGTAPGSTGGGIKVTTFVLILFSSIGNIRGQKTINIDKKQIPNDLVNRAYALLLFAFAYNSLAVFLLTVFEPEKNVLALVFEQISAFATVGLSMNLTALLSDAGKTIIIISMFVGRVGPITLALALSSRVKTNAYQYPQATIMIG